MGRGHARPAGPQLKAERKVGVLGTGTAVSPSPPTMRPASSAVASQRIRGDFFLFLCPI